MKLKSVKKVIAAIICTIIFSSFIGCTSGDNDRRISEIYKCKEFTIEIKDPVFLPGYNNALAVVWEIENTSEKDEYPINFAHCEVYMDGIALNPFVGTYDVSWMDYFKEHDYQDIMTKFVRGGRLTTYNIFVIDANKVDSDKTILIRFYKDLLGNEIIAEKEVLIKDIVHAKN